MIANQKQGRSRNVGAGRIFFMYLIEVPNSKVPPIPYDGKRVCV